MLTRESVGVMAGVILVSSVSVEFGASLVRGDPSTKPSLFEIGPLVFLSTAACASDPLLDSPPRLRARLSFDWLLPSMCPPRCHGFTCSSWRVRKGGDGAYVPAWSQGSSGGCRARYALIASISTRLGVVRPLWLKDGVRGVQKGVILGFPSVVDVWRARDHDS